MNKYLLSLLFFFCTISLTAQEISTVPFRISVGTVDRARLVKALDRNVERYASWRKERNSSFDINYFYNVHAAFIDVISNNTEFRQNTNRLFNVPDNINNNYSVDYIRAYLHMLEEAIKFVKDETDNTAQEISTVPFRISVGTVDRARLVKALDRNVERYASWRKERNSSFDINYFYNVHAAFIDVISNNTEFRQNTNRLFNVPDNINNNYSVDYIRAYLHMLEEAIKFVKK